MPGALARSSIVACQEPLLPLADTPEKERESLRMPRRPEEGVGGGLAIAASLAALVSCDCRQWKLFSVPLLRPVVGAGKGWVCHSQHKSATFGVLRA